MNELITIVIPVYNLELYIRKCLDSIMNQSYRNIEVIIVDNGSTDGTYDICDEYTKLDTRFKLFKELHKGVSYARNSGIEKASGKYILFVDGDDTIASNYVEQLYNAKINLKSDMVFCGCHFIDGNTECVKRIAEDHQDSGNLCNDFYKIYLGNTRIIVGTPFCKLFDMELIRKLNLRFNTQFINHEDAIFSFTYLGYCKTYSIIDNTYYNYWQYNRGSASESYSEKRISNEIDFFLFVSQWLDKNHIKESESIIVFDLVATLRSISFALRKSGYSFLPAFKNFCSIADRLPGAIVAKNIKVATKTKLVIRLAKAKLYLPIFIYYWLKRV